MIKKILLSVAVAIVGFSSHSQTLSKASNTATALASRSASIVGCVQPINLSAATISQTSAQISWANGTGSTATSWEVAVQAAGSVVPSGSGITTNSNSNYHIDATSDGIAFTAATAYQYWVRAYCGDGTYSAWSGPFLFTTASCDSADQCNYTFTLSDLSGDGWNGGRMEVIQNGIATTIGATMIGSTQIVVIPLCNHMPFELFWSIAGDFPGEIRVNIKNSFNQSIYALPTNGQALVGTTLYSETINCSNPLCDRPAASPTVPASTITYNSAVINWVSSGLLTTGWGIYVVPQGSAVPGANTTASYTVSAPTASLTIPAGDLTPDTSYTVYVRSICSANGPSDWTIGTNFKTKEQCVKPTALTANAATITPFGATLSWTNPSGTSWQYIVQPVGFPAPTATTVGWVDTASISNAVTGLTPETAYEYYVRTNCGIIFSNPAGPRAFTTKIACAKPTALIVPTTTTLGATFNWTSPTATAWQVLVLPVGAPAPTTATAGMPVVSRPYVYNGPPLTPETSYAFYVRSDCGGVNGLSTWSGPKAFTTLPSCYKPTNFLASQATAFSVVLTWTTPTTTTAWQVLALPAGSNPPTADATGWQATDGGGGTGSNYTYTYQNLSADTIYNFYIRGNCDPVNGLSSWAGPKTLKTLPSCYPPTALTANDPTAFGAQLSWTNHVNSPATQWQIVISTPGAPPPAATQSGTIINTNPYTANGLLPESCYQYYVRSSCGGINGNSVWIGPYNFCTLPTCQRPTNLAADNTGAPLAGLSWTETNNATQWEIIVQSRNGAIPTDDSTGSLVTGTVTGTTVNYNTNLLDPGLYEFYVRSDCSEIDKSHWTGPFHFFVGATQFNCTTINFDMPTTGPGLIDLCNGENCIDLAATYPESKDTTTYTVLPLLYNPPFPYTGGTQLPIDTDDQWSVPFALPFDFCFYGVNYPTLHVGSNGVLTFTPQLTGTACPWNTDPLQIIPNPEFPIRNAIYGVFQDINPTVVTDPVANSINYQVLGVSPCRAFVVNYYNIGQYQCGISVGLQTSQIVLYETSNVIEIYVQDRTVCDWNEGSGIIGIQNEAGTLAHFPPERNLGAWEAHNEAWQFKPDGASNTTFSWLKNGVFYSNNPTVNVCVSENTNMTAQAQYTSCGGVVTTTSSNVLLNIVEDIAPTGMSNQTVGLNATLGNLVVNGQGIQWYGAPDSETPLASSTVLVNGLTYYASQTNGSCESHNRLAVTVQVSLSNVNFNSIKISYSPNPVHDLLSIKGSVKLKTVKVCNLLGQTLVEQKCNANDIEVNMASLATGTYIVLVESEGSKETFKIMKE